MAAACMAEMPADMPMVVGYVPMQLVPVQPVWQPVQQVPMQPVQPVWPQLPLVFTGGCIGHGSKVHRILCYGDSMTVGYCHGGSVFEPYACAMANRLGFSGIASEITVCGLSGRRADEMVAAASSALVDNLGFSGKGLVRTLREDGPFDLVLVMAGTNDMGGGSSPGSIIESLQCLHCACHELGVPTVALAPPPAPGRGMAWEMMRQPIVDALRQMSMQMPRMLACVDPATLVPATWSGCWDPDGLHFSVAGSIALGQGLAELACDQFLPFCAAEAPQHRKGGEELFMRPANLAEMSQWQPSPTCFQQVPVYAFVLVQV